MKVETNLKSGAFLQSAADGAVQAANEVGSFVTKAGQQAQTFTHAVTGKVGSVWNCLAQ